MLFFRKILLYTETDQIYASYILKTEDELYTAERDERADVVAVLGDESLLNSGYEFLLPVTIFEDSDFVDLYGCDEAGVETLLYSWKRKE